MTRADLADWLRAHGCEIVILPEGRARVVMYRNPKTGTTAFLHSPIDETRVENFTICKICMRLGIEIPDVAKHCSELNDDLQKRDFTK